MLVVLGEYGRTAMRFSQGSRRVNLIFLKSPVSGVFFLADILLGKNHTKNLPFVASVDMDEAGT